MGTELFLHCHTFISAKSGVLFPLLLFQKRGRALLPPPPSPAPALALMKGGVQGAELDLLHLHSSVLSLQHLGTLVLGKLCVSITAESESQSGLAGKGAQIPPRATSRCPRLLPAPVALALMSQCQPGLPLVPLLSVPSLC